MNTDNYNRFDELIREKLDSYEAEPDMDLLVNIHARKNRFLKSRNLLTIIALLAILMAGIIGGYYLSNQEPDQSQHAKEIQGLSLDNRNGHSTAYPDQAVSNGNPGKTVPGATASLPAKNPGSGFPAGITNHHAALNSNRVNNAASTASLHTNDVHQQLINNIHPAVKSTVAVPVAEAMEVREAASESAEKPNKDKAGKTVDECQAAFDYYTSYDHSFNFLSSITSSGNVLVKWQFGDGQTSTDANPKHIYDKAGQYAVTLTAVNTKTNCKAEVYKLVRVIKDAEQTSSSIKGTVFADAEYASKIMVQLIAENGQIVQSTITSNKGQYEFNEIGPGSYLIKTAGYKNYQATFYGNTAENDLATNIAIFKDDYESFSGYDIQMIATSNAMGNNPMQLDSGSRLMIVLDENNNPLTTVVVNANGTITSPVKLPAGNYSMLDAQSGKPAGGLNVGNDGSIGSQAGSGQPDVSAGMNEVKLSPNPAAAYVNVGLTNANNSPLEVTIINYAGAIVKQFTLPNGNTVSSIDINSLSSGTYHVIVKQNGIAATSTLIKGSDNSK